MTDDEIQARKARRAWAQGLKRGDVVRPAPLWNETEPQRNRKLPDRVEILDATRESNCSTGVMLTVESKSGQLLYLSAGWFYPIEG